MVRQAAPRVMVVVTAVPAAIKVSMEILRVKEAAPEPAMFRALQEGLERAMFPVRRVVRDLEMSRVRQEAREPVRGGRIIPLPPVILPGRWVAREQIGIRPDLEIKAEVGVSG